MKSLGKFPDPFVAEIAGQPGAIRRAIAGLREQLPTLERIAANLPGRQLMFTGMGSSYFACYPVITYLASKGVAALHVDASELIHFRGNLIGPATVLVAVSQSGESAETIRCVEELATDASVLAITNGTDNTLTRASAWTIDTRAGEETGPSTMTFAGALIALAAIGPIAAGDDPTNTVGAVAARAEAAATELDALLADGSLPDRLGGWFEGRERSVILGRGPARAAAEMGALTLKEAVGLPIESLETAQFRHGPLELAGPGLAAFVIATEPETRELDLRLAAELLEAGAGVWVVVDRGDVPPGAEATTIGALDRAVAPAVSILPSQLLAWKLAILHGRPPGAYLRASKVTTHE